LEGSCDGMAALSVYGAAGRSCLMFRTDLRHRKFRRHATTLNSSADAWTAGLRVLSPPFYTVVRQDRYLRGERLN
jgi:hypothetical protein